MEEKTLSSQTVFRGKILNLRVDTVRLPNGNTAAREVVEFAGAVAVVALDAQEHVYLVRQYRYPVGRVLLEIPAGKLEPGEDPLVCAQRELSEETGVEADEWHLLSTHYSSPGFLGEKIHLFLARQLKFTGAHPDADEFVQVVHIPLAKALEMVSRGEICDAKSMLGLLTVARRYR